MSWIIHPSSSSITHESHQTVGKSSSSHWLLVFNWVWFSCFPGSSCAAVSLMNELLFGGWAQCCCLFGSYIMTLCLWTRPEQERSSMSLWTSLTLHISPSVVVSVFQGRFSAACVWCRGHYSLVNEPVGCKCNETVSMFQQLLQSVFHPMETWSPASSVILRSCFLFVWKGRDMLFGKDST